MSSKGDLLLPDPVSSGSNSTTSLILTLPAIHGEPGRKSLAGIPFTLVIPFKLLHRIETPFSLSLLDK